MTTTRLINIGSSYGLCIPEALLDQLQLSAGDMVELEIRGGELVVRSCVRPRSGWSEHFQRMAHLGDDRLLDETPSPTAWEESEWEW